ncbi:hypothetical protein KKH23_08725, partial [Patescibacteria group bacterium]|nr:hypothetical protein [Patescibacteria group bacterium]
MTETILHNDRHEVHEERGGMPCGHPRSCIVQDDEGTGYCAWCEDVARLREALARRIHKHRADLASVLHARNEFAEQIYEWYEECCEEVERLREELEQAEARGATMSEVAWLRKLILDSGDAERLALYLETYRKFDAATQSKEVQNDLE